MPFTLTLGNDTYSIRYEPGESTTSLFGGNSNWRGPIWAPMNTMIIRALLQMFSYTGNDFRVDSGTAEPR